MDPFICTDPDSKTYGSLFPNRYTNCHMPVMLYLLNVDTFIFYVCLFTGSGEKRRTRKTVFQTPDLTWLGDVLDT